MAFFASLIVIDQIAKYLVRHLGGFYICNKGIAFSINIPQVWLWILLVLLFFIILQISKSKFQISNELLNFKFQNLPAILVLAGAISNIIDRLYFGCVIDFINLKIWPVFNLADVFIIIGAIILILQIKKQK